MQKFCCGLLALLLVLGMSACAMGSGRVTSKASTKASTRASTKATAKDTAATDTSAEGTDTASDSSSPSLNTDYTGAQFMMQGKLYTVTEQTVEKDQVGDSLGKITAVTDTAPSEDGEAMGLSEGMEIFTLQEEGGLAVLDKGVYYLAKPGDGVPSDSGVGAGTKDSTKP